MPGPGRPPNDRDMFQFTNGSPVYLGALVSTGAAVNNFTTATPFNQTMQGPNTVPGATPNFAGTLAGKLLLLQPTAAGLILPSSNPNIIVGTVVGQSIVAQQTVMPPAVGTAPGVSLSASERVLVLMLPTEGWLQWLPVTGSANLLVWELR